MGFYLVREIVVEIIGMQRTRHDLLLARFVLVALIAFNLGLFTRSFEVTALEASELYLLLLLLSILVFTRSFEVMVLEVMAG